MVLGAYTAGMMIAMLTKVEILQYRLTSIGSGFLIPLFFITSGVEFDLPALVTSPASLARLMRREPISKLSFRTMAFDVLRFVNPAWALGRMWSFERWEGIVLRRCISAARKHS
jgi:Kef-type K+ transport system membrane component KefB